MRRGAKHIYLFLAILFVTIYLIFLNIEINNMLASFVPFDERPPHMIFDDEGNFVPNPEYEPFEQMPLYLDGGSSWPLLAYYAVTSAPWVLLLLFVAIIMTLIWIKQMTKQIPGL